MCTLYRSWNTKPKNAQNSHVVPINPAILSQPADAVRQMEAAGSHYTYFSPFGQDPLKDRIDLFQRQDMFSAQFPHFDDFFHTVVNGDFTVFRRGLLYIIDISSHLTSLLQFVLHR